MKNKKVLIIGLDGATWKVLKPALAAGYMPHLRSLIDGGTSGILQSTQPAITPAAWSSFQTGANPGRNGIFDFTRWSRETRELEPVSSRLLRKTIWQAVSEVGYKVGVVNVPLTFPPKKVNGAVVTGILTPSTYSEFTYPLALKKYLLEAVPNYHIFNMGNIKKNVQHSNWEVFVARMVEVITMRRRAGEYLLNNDNFDLFMLHFQASDVVQHALWGYLDETHKLYNPDTREEIFARFYQSLDRQLKQVQDAFAAKAGSEFLTLVISDHGFQRHDRRFNLGNWLVEEGFLRLDRGSFGSPRLVEFIKKLDLFDLRFKMLGQTARRRVRESISKAEGSGEQIYWESSTAFAVGRSGEGFIYLLEEDLTKRQQTAEKIIKKLSRVVDDETGKRVTQKVYHKEEVWQGENLKYMPDLFVEPDDAYTFTGAYQPDQKLFHTVTPESDFHVGKHHRDGVIVAAGNGVKSQSNLKMRLIDVVPTLLEHLEISPWEGLDGRVQEGLLGK